MSLPNKKPLEILGEAPTQPPKPKIPLYHSLPVKSSVTKQSKITCSSGFMSWKGLGQVDHECDQLVLPQYI